MTAWVAYTDPLCVKIDQAIAGQNFLDNRSIWHGLSDIIFSTGSISGAVWYQDSGPLANAASILEARAFCTKGQASFSFTGRTLIVRLNVAFSWYTAATVTIDGVAPSTLGLLTSVDILSCDAATYQLVGDGYIDVVVADGLTVTTPHTCIITINSPNPIKFFSISGFKVGIFTSQPLARNDGWLVPADFTLFQNAVTLSVTNRGIATVVSPTLTFPSGLVDGSNVTLTTLSAGTLAPTQTLSQTVLPVFTGNEHSGQFSYYFTLSAQYADPNGIIVTSTPFTALVGNVAVLTVTGTWYQDILTPNASQRLYTAIFGAFITFTFVGDALTLTIQQSLSWGVIGIYASDNSTLLNSVTCNVDTGGALATITLTGFGAGSHTVYLRKTVDDSAFIVFVSASWAVTQNFTAISETIILNYAANQPIALPVQSVSVGPYDVTFAPPAGTQDFSGTPVRRNTNLVYTEVLTRFPTYAVCYKSGFADILAQYDILIVDPFAAHVADVLAWQANGIKVFGYISSGEEVGFYANRYDFTSALAPNAGAGPGGYATYFMYTLNPNFPDEEGVFASYYINPDPAFGWPDRIANYYAPQVLSGPVVVTDEVVTTKSATIAAGSVIVFDTAQSPLDIDSSITLKTLDGVTTYTTYRDYTFDAKTGAFVLSVIIAPSVTIGQQLKISYTRKGHRMDGVFFDTVDTPDVYTGTFGLFPYVAGYASQFANLINNFKAAYPAAWLISNRGFTILPNIIQSCKGVMFETWLTIPTDLTNLTTTDYVIIADSNSVAYNDSVNTMLRNLRLTHEFDVYSLNYCHADSRGDVLRAYCRAQDAQHGYLSWQSTITLDVPAPNVTINTPGLPIQTRDFSRYKMKNV